MRRAEATEIINAAPLPANVADSNAELTHLKDICADLAAANDHLAFKERDAERIRLISDVANAISWCATNMVEVPPTLEGRFAAADVMDV